MTEFVFRQPTSCVQVPLPCYAQHRTANPCELPATHPPFPADAWRPPVSNRPDRIAELEAQLAEAQAQHAAWERELASRLGAMEVHCDLLGQRLAAMTVERDHALLRMEVAIATSHAWIDAEVRRRIAEATDHAPSAFPASALRQQRQAIGLLSTADAGRVRLGGYAPSLPPR